MKRLFLSAAVLAVAASCSTNEVTDIAPAAQSTAIGFSTLNDRVTKAANDDASDYKVYAVSSADASAWYIDDYATDGGTGDDAVQYGPYYWPTGATLDFYAYAPYSATNGVVTEDSNNGSTATNFVISYTVVNTPAVAGDGNEDEGTPAAIANVDFTYASLSEYDYDSSNGYADFEFSHMLAKINSVTIELNDALLDIADADGGTTSNYTYEIASATFDVVNDVVTVTNGVGASSQSATPSTGTIVDNYDLAMAVATADATSAATTGSTVDMMIAPHAAGSVCTITLNGLKIYNTNGALVFGGATGEDVVTYSFLETQAFAASVQYAITITMDLSSDELGSNNEILFSADITSAGWGTTATDVEL